jgi:hypothetical protein
LEDAQSSDGTPTATNQRTQQNRLTNVITAPP